VNLGCRWAANLAFAPPNRSCLGSVLFDAVGLVRVSCGFVPGMAEVNAGPKASQSAASSMAMGFPDCPRVRGGRLSNRNGVGAFELLGPLQWRPSGFLFPGRSVARTVGKRLRIVVHSHEESRSVSASMASLRSSGVGALFDNNRSGSGSGSGGLVTGVGARRLTAGAGACETATRPRVNMVSKKTIRPMPISPASKIHKTILGL